MQKFLVIGNGGREAVFADALSKDAIVYALMGHENPTIVDAVTKTGGSFKIGDINDGSVIADFAIEQKIDYVFVNSDNPLANGVVDQLLARDIKAIGPTKEAARIEWDKVYSIEFLESLLPQYVPIYKLVSDASQIDEAIAEFAGKDIVVKPQGLTGGKGVKVMGEHLKDLQEVKEYTNSLLASGDSVLLVEKIQGLEFTIMAITDGKNIKFAPATYDYPYRFEGDTGPGTGGMGCFTDVGGNLPFLSQDDLDDCYKILQTTIDALTAKGLHYNGVLYGGFFLTAEGVKFIEFNSRFGDPEGINICSLLKSSFSEMLIDIYHQKLDPDSVQFAQKASVVKYLVSKDYPSKGPKVDFTLPVEPIKEEGGLIHFSAAKQIESENQYQTVSVSRVVAITALSDSIVSAAEKVNNLITNYYTDGKLDYRSDIATQDEINKLKRVGFELVGQNKIKL